jgi:hypothetical protein
MSARVSLSLAAALLFGVGAHAACPPGQTRGCAAIDLNAVPEISQQIIARDAAAPAAPKRAAPADAAAGQPYTGPTFGVSDRARRAPMVGYRWSID